MRNWGTVSAKDGKHAHQSGLTVRAEEPGRLFTVGFVAHADDVFRLFLQFAGTQVAPVLDHDGEAAGSAHAAHRRRTKHRHLGFADLLGESLAELVGDGLAEKVGIAPLFIGPEIDEQGSEIRPRRVEDERLADDAGGVPNPRRVFGNGLDLPHHLVGPFHGGGIGKLHVDHQITHVLRGNESLGSHRETIIGQRQQAAVDQQDYHADAQYPAYQTHISGRHFAKAPVEPADEMAQAPVVQGTAEFSRPAPDKDRHDKVARRLGTR